MSKRSRMTGVQRREQLIFVARQLFASNGFGATSIEEVATNAGVSKPIVYQHFGGKEGLYAVIVDREITELASSITRALETADGARAMAEGAALALFDYIESNTDGFRILVQDSPLAESTGSFSSVMGDVAAKVEYILANRFADTGLEPDWAPIYAQMLVGMTSQIGQWWLEEQQPQKDEVAAHLVNLAWYGLRHLHTTPNLVSRPTKASEPDPPPDQNLS